MAHQRLGHGEDRELVVGVLPVLLDAEEAVEPVEGGEGIGERGRRVRLEAGWQVVDVSLSPPLQLPYDALRVPSLREVGFIFIVEEVVLKDHVSGEVDEC